MFTKCQHLYTLCGEERRRIERRMSICLTRFPIIGLGESNITSIGLNYKKVGDFTWRGSECEKLAGVTHRR